MKLENLSNRKTHPKQKRMLLFRKFPTHLMAMLLVAAVCLLSFNQQTYAQAPSLYPLKTNEVEIGFTMATILLAVEVELSVTLIRRVSEKVVFEVKPVVGYFGVTHNFNDNEDNPEYIYSGGTVGINLGKKNDFFELTMGAAYFGRIKKSQDFISPLGTIGYKVVRPTATFRVGLGFPYGVYVGLNF